MHGPCPSARGCEIRATQTLRRLTFTTMSCMEWEWSSTKDTGRCVPHSSSTSRANWMAASESPPSWVKLLLPSPIFEMSIPSVRAAACTLPTAYTMALHILSAQRCTARSL